MEDEVKYYYDSHQTEKDRMGEPSNHSELVRYLWKVLEWLFQVQTCTIYKNLNFYQTRNPQEYPLAPDIAVIKGVTPQHLRSWKVGLTGLAPQVVFEIASEETWKNDLQEKPFKYATMGVKEYFFYDPGDSAYWRRTKRRLIGWQLDQTTGTVIEMVPDQQGRLWSQQFESFLVPDDMYLRLYDSNNQRRLTEAEALAQQNKALIQKLRSLGVNPDAL